MESSASPGPGGRLRAARRKAGRVGLRVTSRAGVTIAPSTSSPSTAGQASRTRPVQTSPIPSSSARGRRPRPRPGPSQWSQRPPAAARGPGPSHESSRVHQDRQPRRGAALFARHRRRRSSDTQDLAAFALPGPRRSSGRRQPPPASGPRPRPRPPEQLGHRGPGPPRPVAAGPLRPAGPAPSPRPRSPPRRRVDGRRSNRLLGRGRRAALLSGCPFAAGLLNKAVDPAWQMQPWSQSKEKKHSSRGTATSLARQAASPTQARSRASAPPAPGSRLRRATLVDHHGGRRSRGPGPTAARTSSRPRSGAPQQPGRPARPRAAGPRRGRHRRDRPRPPRRRAAPAA